MQNPRAVFSVKCISAAFYKLVVDKIMHNHLCQIFLGFVPKITKSVHFGAHVVVTFWLFMHCLLTCCVPVVGKASEVVEFVVSLESQVLHAVLQLFNSQFDAFTVHSTQFPLLQSHMQSSNQTDEQKMPDTLLLSNEMMDRFKKLVITSVNFVLFSR